MHDDKELRDHLYQVEAQLLATQAAIRSILTAVPQLRPSVAQELEQVRAARPGRVVSDSVFSALDRAIRRMLPAEAPATPDAEIALVR
ncbi:hypothetical protein ABXN37_19505 [Piscinibacter sakaiensis]|uniref:Uncharacterized protein n=1 Tax=Piscinibacter sakaiensis TaxID=1547922 RepID=A0A0K8P426_PISS1|nr:hypothetical protein [Piscinibacter sakaiensis]GAP37314.1 hypothetical protein ISF6_3169 [Piscinibacter sakaiensis]